MLVVGHRPNFELYVSAITFSGDRRHRLAETADIRLLHAILASQLRPRFTVERLTLTALFVLARLLTPGFAQNINIGFTVSKTGALNVAGAVPRL